MDSISVYVWTKQPSDSAESTNEPWEISERTVRMKGDHANTGAGSGSFLESTEFDGVFGFQPSQTKSTEQQQEQQKDEYEEASGASTDPTKTKAKTGAKDAFLSALHTDDLAEALLHGTSVSLLCYGGRKTGKSHLLFGTKENPGAAQKLVQSIFAKLPQGNITPRGTSSASAGTRVTLAWMDVRNEVVRDGLQPERGALALMLGTSNSAADSPSRVHLTDADHFHRLVFTPNTEGVSPGRNIIRSHTILQVGIETTTRATHTTTRATPGSTKTTFLYIVEVAWSERSATPLAQLTNDPSSREAIFRKGFIALNMVVSKLSESVTSSVVPFRDSKLTRILQPAFTAPARTVLVCCMDTSSESTIVDESISTLRFAARAKKIRLHSRSVPLTSVATKSANSGSLSTSTSSTSTSSTSSSLSSLRPSTALAKMMSTPSLVSSSTLSSASTSTAATSAASSSISKAPVKAQTQTQTQTSRPTSAATSSTTSTTTKPRAIERRATVSALTTPSVTGLQDKIQELTEENKKLTQELEQVQSARTIAAAAEKQVVEDSLMDKINENTRLLHEIQELRARLAYSEKLALDAQEKADSLAKTLEQESAEKDESIGLLKADILEYQDKEQEWTEESALLREELQEYKSQGEEKDKRLEYVLALNASAAASAVSDSQTIQSQTQELSKKDTAIKELQAQIAEYQRKESEWLQESSNFKQQVQEYKTRVDEKDKQIESLLELNVGVSLTESLNVHSEEPTSHELETKESAIRELQSQIVGYQQKESEWKRENEALQKGLQDYKKRLDEKEKQIESILDLNMGMFSASSQGGNSQAEEKSAKTIADLEAKLRKANDQLSFAHSDLDKVRIQSSLKDAQLSNYMTKYKESVELFKKQEQEWTEKQNAYEARINALLHGEEENEGEWLVDEEEAF